MPDMAVVLNEEQRQMLALALALLWLDRAGWRNAIAELSGVLETDRQMEEFVTFNQDRFHPDPL